MTWSQRLEPTRENIQTNVRTVYCTTELRLSVDKLEKDNKGTLNNKEAPMHDAFLHADRLQNHIRSWFGPAVAALAVLMSSQVLQATPHIVGLISSAIYRALHLSVERTYHQHHESQCEHSSRFQPDLLDIRTCSPSRTVMIRSSCN